MGNYRFKLSDLVSNSWFYKLKDIGNKTRNRKQTTKYTNSQQPKPDPHQQFRYTSYARKSYHITRELNPTSCNSPRHEPARRSSKQTIKGKIRTPRSSVSCVSASCSCRATLWTKSDSPADSSLSTDSDSSPKLDSDISNKLHSNADKEVNKDVIVKETDRIHIFDKISDLDLRPIITKPVNDKIAKNVGDKETKIKIKSNSANHERNAHTHGSLSVKIVKEQNKSSSSYAKKHSANSPGVRLRTNSPRIATRKCYPGQKNLSSGTSSRRWSRSVSDSLAIVKASFDPQRDFKESMMEMVIENNIRTSKDLEELLAAYLSLNSNEYHHLIIKVFKQIWFDVTRN